MALETVVQIGVIAAPLQVLFDRLVTAGWREISHLLGVDGDSRKLQRSLERLRAVADVYEENRSYFSNSMTDKAWKLCLEEVEALLYSAEDLLDDISLGMSKCSEDTDGENQVRDTIIEYLKVTVPSEVKRICMQVEGILNEMEVLNMTHQSEKTMKCRKIFGYSCAMVGEGSLIGRERERNDLVRMLLDEDLNDGVVSVLPVVGMGGIGKTALARLVYNDEEIKDKFDLKMWASASINGDIIGILNSIIESAMKEKSKLSCLDSIQVKLRDLIRGKKFLLVLDDYWSEEYIDWHVLSASFRYAAKGSKVILTTRSTIVSQIVGTVGSYNVECLSDDKCCEILKEIASPDINLEELRRMIAKKCKGLPLAATILGSTLCFKDDPAEWTSILESDMWELEKNGISQALAISYYHLPTHLKKCFTYCSIFPRGHVFDVNDLILLWMSEGFICPKGSKRLEEVGIEYFNSLLWRSFFQRSKDDDGRDIYKMHDLVHNMAQLVSRGSCLCSENGQVNQDHSVSKSARHASLHYVNAQTTLLEGRHWYKNLRTFRVISKQVGNVQVSYRLFSKFKVLRVLDLRSTNLLHIPTAIGNLKHLRYLNLSDNGFINLPENLANLVGLQVLKLEKCFELATLPSLMKNLVSLRHLLLEVCLFGKIAKIGELVNLQSLPIFFVSKVEGHRIVELGNLNMIRGCICIKNLENVADVNEAKGANLHAKPFLDRLELEWNDIAIGSLHEETLAGLCPHENVKEFVMKNYQGHLWPSSWFSSWKISSISLQGCTSIHILNPLGKLQHLKTLVIERMSNWKIADENFSGFPSLESLTIRDIPDMTSWGFFGTRFPQLSILEMDNCPLLRNFPFLGYSSSIHSLSVSRCPEIKALPQHGFPPSIQTLAISNCAFLKDRCRPEGADWQKIRTIPNILVDNVNIGI